MFVCIDPSRQDTIRVLFFDTAVLCDEQYAVSNREVLACLAETLTKHGYTKADVRGIAVVVGAGSFTSTRIAVTVANTWAFARQIPVVGISSTEIDTIAALQKKIAVTAVGTLVSATYSGEPTIGPKKQ